MLSMPPTGPHVTTSDQTIQAMSRMDGCPGCVQNATLPRAVITYSDGFTAGYHCEDCGHYWLTNWSYELPDWAV